MADDKRVGRRRFFREALGEMFKPLERKAAPFRRAIEEFNRIHQNDRKAPSPPQDVRTDAAPPHLRPPQGRTSARGETEARRDARNDTGAGGAAVGGESDAIGRAEAGGGQDADRSEGAPASADGTDDAEDSEPPARLRPPGALPEGEFANVCSRCGECARVCPAQCIRLDPADGAGGRGDGLPFINVDVMPCVLCDGLLCMHNCPTTALRPTALVDIDMGTAEWHEDTCVRSRREECTTCIDQCPVGPTAIELDGNRVHVHDDGCVGCGVCEHYCPTSPKSITVRPRGGRLKIG